MAKSKRRQSSASSTSENESEAGAKSYIVKPGQTVQHGSGDGTITTYTEGDSIELSAVEAAGIPWAVELEGKPARAGQTSRLKRQINDLNARIRDLQAANEALKSGEDDEALKAAKDSIVNRADNFAIRGEPSIGGPSSTAATEAADRQFVAEEMGDGFDIAADHEPDAGQSTDPLK